MLSLSQSLPQEGINYAVPASWWKKYRQLHSATILCSSNNKIDISDIAAIDNYSIIDTFLVDFEQEILSELSQKSNNLFFHHKFISPMLLPTAQIGEDFHLVSSSFWHQLSKQYKASYPILIFAFKQYDLDTSEKLQKVNGLIVPLTHKQIQIIFCTDKIGSLFIGFLPENADLLSMIRLIMKEIGIIEKPQSKISFLGIDLEATISLSKLQPRKIKDLSEGELFIMIINLLSQTTMEVEDELNISMQAINKSTNDSGLNTAFFQEITIMRPDHKTISTGASTPLTFSIDSDHQNQFHLVQMLRQKTQHEINELRELAIRALEGEQIMVDHTPSENNMRQELQVIRDQIIDLVGVHKKKIRDKDFN